MTAQTEPLQSAPDGDAAVDDSLARRPLEPLRLLAEDDHDLAILSAALQDAVLTPADIVWERAARRVTLSLNRYCWECGGSRVRAALQFGDVETVKSRRLPRLPDAPLELLALDFAPAEAPGGRVVLMFSGGGDLRIDVECLDAVLVDLDQPYAVDGAPSHGDGQETST